MNYRSKTIPFLVFAATVLVLYAAGVLKVDDGRVRSDDNSRLDRIERHQHEIDDRLDALSSQLRAAVRPIGWDLPRDR